MKRSTTTNHRIARALFALGTMFALITASGLPADAAGKTTVSISKATKSGKVVSITGKVAAGADGAGAAKIVDDPKGDDVDTAVPNGTDIGTAFLQADLAHQTLVFTINVLDAMPGISTQPGFVFNWQFTVNGNDTGLFLQAGQISGLPNNTPPSGTTFSYLCQSSGTNFGCDHTIPGTIANGTVTLTVPFNLIGAGPGSVIGTGAQISGAATIATTLGAGQGGFENNNGGDDAQAVDFTIPGGVRLGIAKAGTPLAKVPMKATAIVTGSTFRGSVPTPKAPGNYIVVAKTCYGAGVCVLTSKTVKI